jgi:hypothetical protein
MMNNSVNIEHRFIDGKIYVIVKQLVWGEWVTVTMQDVTETLMPVVDDYLDKQLGMTDYKHTNGRLKYTGDKKY